MGWKFQIPLSLRSLLPFELEIGLGPKQCPRFVPPKEYGALGVHNLYMLNQALRMRWRWFKKTVVNKPWAGLPINLKPAADALSLAALHCVIGDGRRTLFRSDRWVDGRSVAEMAPNLFACVRPAGRRKLVAEALPDHMWIQDIRGAPSVPAIAEFLQLWPLIQQYSLSDGDDSFWWRCSVDGKYSARSAYAASSMGESSAPATKNCGALGHHQRSRHSGG